MLINHILDSAVAYFHDFKWRGYSHWTDFIYLYSVAYSSYSFVPGFSYSIRSLVRLVDFFSLGEWMVVFGFFYPTKF